MKNLKQYIEESLLDDYSQLEENQDISIWFDECNQGNGYSYELKNGVLTISRTRNSLESFEIVNDIPSQVKKVVFAQDCYIIFKGENMDSDLSKYEFDDDSKVSIIGSFKNNTIINAHLPSNVGLGGGKLNSTDNYIKGVHYVFKNSSVKTGGEIIIRKNVILSIEDLIDGLKIVNNSKKYIRIWIDGDFQDISRYIQKIKKTKKILPIFDKLNKWLSDDMHCRFIYSYAREFKRDVHSKKWIEEKAWS
jgi:hypothetical protein